MRKTHLLFFLSFTTLTLFSMKPEYIDLPWIEGLDSEAAFYASPYLPDDPVILEAGVCRGIDTQRFKSIWIGSKIYGFEAFPKLFNEASENTSHLKNIHLFKLALSDRNGKIKFNLSQFEGCSSLLDDNFVNVSFPKSRIDGAKPEENHYKDTPIIVDTVTFDTFAHAQNIPQIDYMWLDAEGAELLILKGAENALENVRAISIEVNFQQFRKGGALFEDLHSYLQEKGFYLQYIWDFNKGEWQGAALYLNSKFKDEPLNYNNSRLFPRYIDKSELRNRL